jgi:hypothetical protein
MQVNDKHPAILVKDAILARSGIYLYSRDEILRMGFTPREDKACYRVYRPPHVLIGAKDKFAFAVVTKEHPADDTSPDNFKKQAEGFVGNDITVVALDDGNIGLKGKIAFYTQDMADYFERGNKDTSAQYHLDLLSSTNPARDGYDFVMTEITSVNGLAITKRGRGGSGVRVLDSITTDKAIGGYRMKKGFLAFLGIGKAKDENFKFSDVLLGSMEKVKALDAADTAGIDKEVLGVMAHITSLGDSEAREVLTGAVSDCYKNIDAVLARKSDVAAKLDELYHKCCDADAEAVKHIFEPGEGNKEGKKPDGKKDDDESGKGKDAQPQNLDAAIAAAVDSAFAKLGESVDAKIDAAMQKALHLDAESAGKKPAADSRSVMDAADMDTSFLLRGVFGNR